MRSKTYTAPPTTIDEYLTRVSDDKRAALQQLRQTILGVIPMAEECISYQIPAFRYDGRVLVYFAAAANHCAFYPGGTVNDFTDELEAYETSKGTIRFQPDRPLPASLVQKIVKARVAQNAARASTAKQAKPKRTKSKQTNPKQARAEQTKAKQPKAKQPNPTRAKRKGPKAKRGR
jgi:uncharacterized protein YdhG (YjbR/CyaY superfamily)